MLSVIVVDYKSIQKTLRYISHLKERLACREVVHYIIVDNNEQQTGLTEIKKTLGPIYNTRWFDQKAVCCFEESNLIYFWAGANLGYAKGNNYGALLSKRYFGDSLFLISNNDLILKDCLNVESISEIFKLDSQIAVVGPGIQDSNGNHQSPYKKIGAIDYLIRPYWSMATHNFISNRDDLDYDNRNKFCYRVMGCFMFIKAEYFFQAEMFDPATFMYAEEMILSERLEKLGLKTFYFNDYAVLHNHGETVKNNATVIQSMKWSFESVFYYYKKYRKCNGLILLLSRLNFDLYVMLYRLKKRIELTLKTE